MHDGVVLVPLQPGRGVVPDLAQQIEAGLDGLQPDPQPAQEIVGDLVAHIKADGVDVVLAHPAFTQPDQIILDGGQVGVQLGHPAVEGEGVVPAVPGVALLKGPPMDEEPAPVGGVGPMGHHVPPGAEVGAAVVEHRVHHHPDALVVGSMHQPAEILLAAEIGIDAGVVGRVVLVDAGGQKDRVEVQAADPQPGQIGQFGGDARQIPAKALGVGDGAFAPGLVRRPAAAAAAEPVGEDLIPDGVPHPVGRGDAVGGIHPGHGEALHTGVQLQHRTQAVLVVVPGLLALLQGEAVAQPAVGRAEHGLPQAAVLQPEGWLHGHPAAFPALLAPGNAGLVGVGVDQLDAVHFQTGAQGDLQGVLIQGAAHGHPRLVENGG